MVAKDEGGCHCWCTHKRGTHDFKGVTVGFTEVKVALYSCVESVNVLKTIQLDHFDPLQSL